MLCSVHRRPAHPLWLLLVTALSTASSQNVTNNGKPQSGETVKAMRGKKVLAGTMDTLTAVVDDTAALVRGVGDTTAATLGASLRLTGGLARSLGNGVQSLGEASRVDKGPMAAPSRVWAGVYRVAGAILTGAGNATVGLGGTVEGIAAEAARVAEDAVKVLGEPTRSLGSALRGGRNGKDVTSTNFPDMMGPTTPAVLPTVHGGTFRRKAITRPRRRKLIENFARRCLREAFGSPSERTVALVPPLILALLAAWGLGRFSSRLPRGDFGRQISDRSISTDRSRSGSQASGLGADSRTEPESQPDAARRSLSSLAEPCQRLNRLRRVCRPGLWIHAGGMAVILMLVLSIDQEQQRHARMMEQGFGVAYNGGREESVRWFNEGVAAIWSPLASESGLAASLASKATASLAPPEEDAFSIVFQNVTFGNTPPIFDSVRLPQERAAGALLSAISQARAQRPNGSVEPRLVMVEADLLWVADAGFEVFLRASAKSTARSILPDLRVRLTNLIFGPVAVAIVMEAAPLGYPYVGLVGITFLSEPHVDFSIMPDSLLGGAASVLPLLKGALVAGLTSSLPMMGEDEAYVYDLGEYLAPGLFPVPEAREEPIEPPPAEPTELHRTRRRRFRLSVPLRLPRFPGRTKIQQRQLQYRSPGEPLRRIARRIRDVCSNLTSGVPPGRA